MTDKDIAQVLRNVDLCGDCEMMRPDGICKSDGCLTYVAMREAANAIERLTAEVERVSWEKLDVMRCELKQVMPINTGIIRRIDELGRIAIPKDIRSQMGIREGELFEIGIQGDKIVLVKHQPEKADNGGQST